MRRVIESLRPRVRRLCDAIRGSGRKRVALTFDDGPDPTYTPQLLSILGAYRARATFFVLGSAAAEYPHLVQQAVAEGHEIACHGWSHCDFSELSVEAVQEQMRSWEETVGDMLAATVRYFRPPHGVVNRTVRSAADELGYAVALWSGDTRDWREPGSHVIYRRAMAAACDGANILMHDGRGCRDQIVAAVRRMVPDLQSRGYQFVTLSELYDQSASQ